MAKARSRPMLDDEALFRGPGYRARRHELHANAVLRVLRAGGRLDESHALAASAIRGAARAVDAAEHVVETQPSAYAAIALSQCSSALAEILARSGLAIGGGGELDSFGAFLQSLDDEHPAAPRNTP